jgi:hypothetical protein
VGILLGASVVALLGLAVPLPVSAEDSPAATATVLTPIQAQAVIGSVWRAREGALERRDRAGVEALEAGSALEYDLAWLDGIIAKRPGGNEARPLFEQLVIVPEQYRYPASFLAIIGFVDPADQRQRRDVWTEVLALTKANQTAARGTRRCRPTRC